MSKILRRCLSLALVVMLLASLTISESISASADNKTGEGLAAHAMQAYNEGWVYSWGGAAPGAVDCSGLIYSYVGGGERTTEGMLYASDESGYVSEGVPDIPGLGLWQSGHVGVYVGGGMAVDARDEYSNVCYQSVASKSWVMWFKVDGVSYGTESSVTNDNQDTNKGRAVQNNEPDYLSKGSSGSEVEALQSRLKELGYFEENTTQYFGSVTEAALMEFQAAAGLEATGVYDKDTQDALTASNVPTKTTQENDNSEEAASDVSEENVNIPTDDGEELSDDTDTMSSLEGEQAEQTLENSDDDSDIKSDNSAIFSFGDNNDGVKNVQFILDKLGYYKGSLDGSYDEDTFNAVEYFQVDNDIDATGLVDESTLNAIFIAFAEKYSQSTELPENNKTKTLGTEPVLGAALSEGESDEKAEVNSEVESDAVTENITDTIEKTEEAPITESSTVTNTEEKAISDTDNTVSNTEAVTKQTETADKDTDVSSEVTPNAATGAIKSGGTNIAASAASSDNTVKSPKTGDPVVMTIESAKEYAAKYIDLRLAVFVTILACTAIFFAGTVHYWNTSMEKRRQRAKKTATVASYRRGSV